MPESYALHRLTRLRRQCFAGSVVCVSSAKQRGAAPAERGREPERISTFDA